MKKPATKTKPGVKLQKEVTDAAMALSLSLPDVVNADGKAYEAWMLFKLVDRLRKLGITVEARNHKNAVTTDFRIKGGPGHIVSEDAPGKQACHFRVVGQNPRPLELHVSIEHVGSSGELHEVDIGLVHGHLAQLIRTHTMGAPYNGPRYLCLELKNYAQDKTLDKNIARAFLGVWLELKDGRWQSADGDILSARAAPPAYSLVTAAAMVDSTVRMLEKYHISAYPGIYPGSTEADDFLDEIADYVRRLVN